MKKILFKILNTPIFRIFMSGLIMASMVLLANFGISAVEPAKEENTAQQPKDASIETGDKREVSIAIIPFEDKTGSTDYSYLAESIQEAVGTEMGKKFKFKMIDFTKVKEAFPETEITKRSDLDIVKKAAETLNADFMIFGDYIYNSTTNQIEMTPQLYLPVIKTNRQLKKISNAVDYTLFSATAKVADSVIAEINTLLDAKTVASTTPKGAEKTAKKEITAEALIKKDAVLRGTGRFVDNGNGIIGDNLKRLAWQKCSAGLDGKNCENGTSEWINWVSATQYCQASKLGNKTWRLPTMEELQSIVRAGNVPSLDKEYFPNSLSKNYWTSTYYGSGTSTVWYIAFFEGNASAVSKSSIGYFRCVADE